MCSRDEEHLVADGVALCAVDQCVCFVDVGKGLSLEWVTEGDGGLEMRVSTNILVDVNVLRGKNSQQPYC
jgi:hypothetical protein